MNINQTEKRLKVVISANFLDNAVYPVRHAAGLTFGYTTTPTGGVDYLGNIINILQSITGAAGTATKISIYSRDWGAGSSVAIKVKCAIYSGNSIITNGNTNEITPNSTSFAWRDLTFVSNPTISAVNYNLCFWSERKTNAELYWWEENSRYDTGSSGAGGRHTGSSYGSWPTLSITNNTNLYGIYATYTASGGGTVYPNHLMSLMGCGN